MRIRLRYVLPVPQMFLAWILMLRSDIWFQHYFAIGKQPAIPTSLPWSLMCAINWPAAIAYIFVWRSRLGHFLSEYVQRAILIALIGILWFWLGRYIDACWKRRTVASFPWRPARFVLDVLVTALTSWLAFYWIPHIYSEELLFERHYSISLTPPNMVIFELWCILPLIFFARDAVLCVMEWRKASAG
jgi:hypothetical protein